MLQILYLLLEGLAVIVPALLAVAFMTIIERKALAATQRRVGPNTVGYYGVLQPFADALKLIVKILFYLAPVIAILVSLLG
jgi:NADH-ubiquinone oxidoreductase chain 1